MEYYREYYAKAQKIIADKSKKRLAEYNKQLDDLHNEIPQLTDIERKIGELGSLGIKLALNGETDKFEKLKKENSELMAQRDEIFSSAGIVPYKPICPVCNDTGYVKGAVCNCVKELAKKLMYEQLCGECPIDECRFDNFDLKFYPDTAESGGAVPRKVMTSVFKMAREYAISFDPQTSKSLLFTGDTGLGKTHLSLAIAGEIIKKGYSVVYGPAQNLFSMAEKEKFSSENGFSKTDALLSCDLLVIDDLGTEFSTSFTLSLFYNIVNTRLLNKKPTIISTNLSLKDIEVKYTPRVLSRFIGNYELIKFFGNDIRQQKALKKR